MKKTDETQQAENFYAHLRGGASPLPDQSSLEDELAGRLQETLNNQPANPAFKEELGKAVQQIARARVERAGRRGRWQFQPFLRFALYAGAAILLLAGLIWSIQNLLPNTPAAQPPVEATPTETAPPTEAAPPEPTTESTPEPEISTPASIPYHISLLPGVEIELQANLPEGPAQAGVYEQLDDESLTPENARAMAQRLGVDGTVYQTPSDSPQQTVYNVSDGKNTIILVNSPYRFNYFKNTDATHGPEVSSLTLEEKISKAEAYLTAAGLLPETYRVEVPEAYPDQVRFQPTIGDAPLWIYALQAPTITVTMDAQGEVIGLGYERVITQPAGEFPIRSAQEAWERLVSGEPTWGVEYIDMTPVEAPDIKWWSRSYPQGEAITLFNYLTVYIPISPTDAQRLALGDYTLQGNTQGMVEANRPGTFFQAWGKLVDEFTFEVSGWQVSPFPDESLEGSLERQDSKAYLATENGRLLLPELPDELVDGLRLRTRGVRLEQPEPTFDWSYVETGEFTNHGSGGGGGGSSFARLTLSGDGGMDNTSLEAEFPVIEPGTLIEAITGTLNLQKNSYPGGKQETITSVYLNDENQIPGIWELRLEGDGISGIEAYNTLPVRIWGTVTSQLPTGQLVVDVERYEPVYPGMQIEAWIGTWEVVNLDGKDIILFSADDGSQFILAGSIEFDPDEFVGYPSSPDTGEGGSPPGSRALLEGVRLPNKTYAGYPLVEERSAAMAEDGMTLEGYEITSDDIWVNEQAAPQGGRLKIERVELAYRANDMRFGPYDPAGGPLYVQPVWSFYGHYEDGREIQFQVQALRDEYLKPRATADSPDCLHRTQVAQIIPRKSALIERNLRLELAGL